MTAPLSLHRLHHALGGSIVSGQVLAPGPDHGLQDRSLSVRPAENDDGFIVWTHSPRDTWQSCKDFVKRKLGESPWEPAAPNPTQVSHSLTDGERTERAMKLWRQAADPHETPVEKYMASRGLSLPADAGEAVRWHSYCPFGKGHRHGCMVALIRNIVTDEPQAIHRTAITAAGVKALVGGNDRMALGPLAAGAVKLTPDAEVSLGLGVGEGIESTLSLRRLPGCESLAVWSLINAAGVQAFPVLPGIEGLWVAVDHDLAGMAAAETARRRWQDAGIDVITCRHRAAGADLNDAARAAHA